MCILAKCNFLVNREVPAVDSHLDAEFKSPFTDSIYPISEHHELSLYKHKMKYKQGKLKGAQKITKIKKDIGVEGNDALLPQHNEKRQARYKRNAVRSRRNRKVLYSNHAEPEKATFLKLFPVELHDNCSPEDKPKHVPSHIVHRPAICATPTYGHFHMFPCMVFGIKN